MNKKHRSSTSQVLVYITAFIGALLASTASASTFDFVALGDTAYDEAGEQRYAGLIDNINAHQPDFSIHVGDTLGTQLCTQTTYDSIDKQFAQFEGPLIYTPGDNEWADCYEYFDSPQTNYTADDHGNYKVNRLAELRKRYFSNANSLGKNTLSLTRQSEGQEHTQFSENAYWIHKEVLFFTAHIVGSSDSFHPHIMPLIDESVARRHANYAWIMHMIEVGKRNQVKAIVMATHAQMFERRKGRTDVA